MSSAYPPFGGAPARPCQRCGMPLPLNEVQCKNCGWQNAPVPGGSPPGLMPSANTWQGGIPPNSFYQPGPAPIMGNGSVPNMLTPGPGQAMANRTYTGPLMNNGAGFAPISQPPFSQPSFPPQAYPPRPSAPLMNGGFRQSGALPPFNSPAPSPKPLPPTRRRPGIGLIVGIAALVVVVVVGALLSPKLFSLVSNAHPNVQPGPAAVKLVPTPTTQALFADQFTGNTNGWNTQSDPGKFSATVGGGALTLEDDNHSLLWELVPGQNGNKLYSDFQIFVDATLSQGDQDNGYGVFIRSALDQNGVDLASFYRFSLYGDGSFAIYKGVADSSGTVTNKVLVDDTVNSAIQKAGMLNHIVISAKGSAISFVVNGQTLGTITDASYAGGLVALFVNNLTDSKTGAQAKFAKLAIFPAPSN